MLGLLVALLLSADGQPVLDKQAMLQRQTFWDNRDWDWYERNVPFLETPDADIDTTYYYRWELLTKHLIYGSPNSGYSFTEFIDRPFWSGAYGSISCPAGHQLYEARWLRDPTFARDYARYWLKTPGAQPRRYSTWLADAAWAVHRVHPSRAFTTSLLEGLAANYGGWEREHFLPEFGLFAQSGHDDGMEYNISSRQTKDILRGDWGLRPTLNSYMWADAKAIAKVARLANQDGTADEYEAKAASLKKNLQEKLWDDARGFYFPVSARDEVRDGHTVRKGSLTYQTGQHAGSPFGRELIGYVPWQFGLPDPGRESAWRGITDPNVFAAEFGPTVTERRDPMFLVTNHCCWWSGQSWPYATSQTLTAMANVLIDYDQKVISKADYFKALKTYTKTHRKGGRPYIAEGANPDTGSFEGYDSPGHSDHYFHSSYNDLIITGLIGLRPGDGDEVVVHPLAPDDWDYFALDDVMLRGHRVSVVWDRDGRRYGVGRGLSLLCDGRVVASSETLGRISAKLPEKGGPVERPMFNYAVNNEGAAFPRAFASHVAPGTSTAKAIDGASFYHERPANRWTCDGSAAVRDHFGIEFGVPRVVESIGLYFLEDEGGKVAAPRSYDVDFWDGSSWRAMPELTRRPSAPAGHRANWAGFPAVRTTALRVTFEPAPESRVGLTEFEAWGPGARPIAAALPEPGNIAGEGKASASYTCSVDRAEEAIDGVVRTQPEPRNRWTAYDSPNPEDWLQVEFSRPRAIGRVDLYLYDDGGGVRAPESYRVQAWDGSAWRDVERPSLAPPSPSGGGLNVARFAPVETSRLRVVFAHAGKARSGVTELEIRAK